MGKPATDSLTLQLPAETSAGLSAVASAWGQSPELLAARVVAEWVGPLSAMFVDAGVRARTEAAAKVRIVEGWRQLRQRTTAAHRPMTPATDAYLLNASIEFGRRIERSTLYMWDRLYTRAGISGLIDGRRPPRAAAEVPPLLVEVRRQLANAPRGEARQHSLRDAYARAVEKAKAKGWRLLSYKSAQRFIAGQSYSGSKAV